MPFKTRFDGSRVAIHTRRTSFGHDVAAGYIIHADGCSHDIRREGDEMVTVADPSACQDHAWTACLAIDDRGEAFAALDVASAQCGIRYALAPWNAL